MRDLLRITVVVRFRVTKSVLKGTLAVGRMCWNVTLPVCSAAHAFRECVGVYWLHTNTWVILPGVGRR